MPVALPSRKRAAPESNVPTTVPDAKRVKAAALPKANEAKKLTAPKAEKPQVNGVKHASPKTKTKVTPKAKPAPKAAPAKTTKPAVEKKAAGPAIINKTPTLILDILACGEGGNGELGLGPKATDVKRPRLNAFLDSKTVGVVQMDAGGMHCVALTHDSKVLTWGVSDEGALGRDAQDTNGNLRDVDDESDSDDEVLLNPLESTPTAIASEAFPADTKFVQVAAGDSASFALTDTGLVYGWGTFRDANGKFGFMLDAKDNVIVNQLRPALIHGLKDVVTIRVGADFALALDKNGDVFGWGTGQQSQLGRRLLDRHRFKSLVPTRIPLPRKKITQIFTGANHAWAIDKDGNTWAWGSNNFGQTGLPDLAGQDNSIITAPTKVAALPRMKMLAGGNHHSIGINANNDCLVWGRMDECQLGIDKSKLPVDDTSKVIKNSRGQPAILLQPTVVLPTVKAACVTAGSEHCLVATDAGKVYSWGFSTNYQTGLGTEDPVELATMIDNTAIRDRKVSWVGGGGQYSMFGAST